MRLRWWRKAPQAPLEAHETPSMEEAETLEAGKPDEAEVLNAGPALDWGGDPSRLSG